MKANGLEIELSRIYQLLDELSGKRSEPDPSAWDGYDRRAYGRTVIREETDAITAKLCGKLTAMSVEEIRQRSPELQMWWRDHQKADRAKAAEAEKRRQKQEARNAALSKLTHAERLALGIKESK